MSWQRRSGSSRRNRCCTRPRPPIRAAPGGAETGRPRRREIYVDLQLRSGRLPHHPTDEALDGRPKVTAEVRRYIDTGKVLAQDGTAVSLDAESICVHGDGPNAVDVARAVRRTLEEAGCLTGPVVAARGIAGRDRPPRSREVPRRHAMKFGLLFGHQIPSRERDSLERARSRNAALSAPCGGARLRLGVPGLYHVQNDGLCPGPARGR